MKTNYIIKAQTENETSTFMTANTKRRIESIFNKLMKSFAKNPLYYVQPIRTGYSKVTYFSAYGTIETEYWIARA